MDGLFCQVPLADYAAHCNTERFVILQIESPEALEKVEEIAAVPGFDALLFGAGDFSHRIGKLGQATASRSRRRPERESPPPRASTANVSAAASLFGQKEQLIEEGTQVFTLGADVISLGDAFRELVASFNEDAGSKSKSDSVYR